MRVMLEYCGRILCECSVGGVRVVCGCVCVCVWVWVCVGVCVCV